MIRWLGLNLFLIGVTLAGSLYVYQFEYDRLPEQVPIHWNIQGEPDGFSAKQNVWKTFLMVPISMAVLLALTVALPWLSPKNFKVESFRAIYDYVVVLVMLLFVYMQGVILLGSLQDRVPLIRLMLGGLFLFFALMGNVMGQVRRNFWMGVRTPWTLASETVWNQTHRLAAWLFVAAGVGGIVGVVLDVTPVLLFVGVMAAVLVPAVYSLVLYKRLERAGKL